MNDKTKSPNISVKVSTHAKRITRRDALRRIALSGTVMAPTPFMFSCGGGGGGGGSEEEADSGSSNYSSVYSSGGYSSTAYSSSSYSSTGYSSNCDRYSSRYGSGYYSQYCSGNYSGGYYYYYCSSRYRSYGSTYSSGCR